MLQQETWSISSGISLNFFPCGATEPLPVTEVEGHSPKAPVRGYIYNMKEFNTKSVDSYLQKTREMKTTIENADTPFLVEGKFPLGCSDSAAPKGDGELNTTASSVYYETDVRR